MNNRPLYENLDTAFVNLSALVKYLRRREFFGRVRVELNNYEADIILEVDNKISVREHDKISGRIAEGEEAFQRLLIRSRESGGTIHVYHQVKQVQTEKVEVVAKVENPSPQKTQTAPPIRKPTEKLELKVAASASIQNGKTPQVAQIPNPSKKTENIAHHPKFPFNLSNRVEAKARQNKLSAEDWKLLLDLTGELLGTIDKSLAEAKLDFKVAFSKARTEISDDYPFLNPSAKIFEYSNGKVTMSEEVSAKLFVASINESLRRILEKLGASPKFAEIYRNTVQKILALINQRQAYYQKFFITPQLKKILGV